MTATLIPAADRHFWSNEWLTSRQSFPGTGNFDIYAGAHGVLAMHNDDVVGPGEGLDAHQHQNMEIITWVVDGAVTHRDSHGHTETIEAGGVGVMTAGRGITHSEGNAAPRSARQSLRVVQMWVPPHADGLDPAHRTADFTDALADGDPVVVASGRREHAGGSALPIANRYAALHVAHPRAGQTVSLPAAPFGHLYVARGTAVVESADLGAATASEGDAIRFTDGGDIRITVPADAAQPAEILFWEMHAHFDVPRPA